MEDQARSSAITEASNRADATALLIRCGFRVYRPEADIGGEDLIVRAPNDQLHPVQLKGRATVDFPKYGGKNILMLFPSARYSASQGRDWYLIHHDVLHKWVKDRHGHAPKWNESWSYPVLSKDLKAFLEEYRLQPISDKFIAQLGDHEIFDKDGNQIFLPEG